MKTYLDCIPCFFQQALDASRLAGVDQKTQKAVVDEFARLISDLPMEIPPPGIAREVHSIIKKHTGIEDSYREIKKESNKKALEIYPKAKEKCKKSEDPLLTAVTLAIAGNVIDYGVRAKIDLDRELNTIMEKEEKAIRHEDHRLFNYTGFKKDLEDASIILYVGDNAGEIVFDRVLMEAIREQYPEKTIIFAVRGEPIINDALMEDALQCGIDSVARIISSGADTPGAVLSRCTAEFREILFSVDMVISKGQGNFESLSGEERTIYFLLMAKCPVVARECGAHIDDVLLFNSGDYRS